MERKNKFIFKKLWDMRELSVDESLKQIALDPDLKFFLTTAGLWLLIRVFLFILIAVHFIYFFHHLIHYVLG